MKRESAWLKAARREKGLTQKELASKIGISVNALSNIEQGQRIGSDETWNKIADFFGEKEYMKVSIETLENILNDIRFDMGIILFKKTLLNITEVGNYKSKDDMIDAFLNQIEVQKKQQATYLYLFKYGIIQKCICVEGKEGIFRFIL